MGSCKRDYMYSFRRCQLLSTTGKRPFNSPSPLIIGSGSRRGEIYFLGPVTNPPRLAFLAAPDGLFQGGPWQERALDTDGVLAHHSQGAEISQARGRLGRGITGAVSEECPETTG